MVRGECAKGKVKYKRTTERERPVAEIRGAAGKGQGGRTGRVTRDKRNKKKKRKKRNSYSRVIGLGQEGAELLDPVVDVETPPSLD